MIESFHETLDTRLDDKNFTILGMEGYSFEDKCNLSQWDPAYGDNYPTREEYKDISPFEPLADTKDEIDPEVYDKYIGAKVILGDTVNGGGNIATVKSCVTDINGRAIRKANNNLLLNSWEYEIEMEDGTTDRLFEIRLPKIFTHSWTMKEEKLWNLTR